MEKQLQVFKREKGGDLMALCAVMFYYHLTPKAAEHMLETLSPEKIAECVNAYWDYHRRRFNER